MHLIQARNVREALLKGVDLLLTEGDSIESEKGLTLAYNGVVATEYQNSKQHVLLNPYRDANPFFHLIEGLWTLAGRRDVAPLNVYIKGYGDRYGVNGLVSDAYGFRWRHMAVVDQLAWVIEILKNRRNTRQAVLQMWNASIDLGSSNPVPCNLNVMFRVRGIELDMTVSNRSNDILFGLYGANAVQFGLLHEYVGAMSGHRPGRYVHMSNDFHMYPHVWDKIGRNLFLDDPTLYGEVYPLVSDPETFDNDLKQFWSAHDRLHAGQTVETYPLNNKFLDGALFMARAYRFHKKKAITEAEAMMKNVPMPDWRQAGTEWLQRRWAKAKQ
jgi:thymidylate synthase